MEGQQTKSIIVKGDVATLYRLWADFENFPSFMKDIKSVTKTGDRTSHWKMEGPLGKNIEWDAVTTAMDVNQRIAWKSTGGDIETSGEVRFDSPLQGLNAAETEVTFTQHYEAGGFGETIARMFDDPDKKLEEILRDFKSYAEGRAQRSAA